MRAYLAAAAKAGGIGGGLGGLDGCLEIGALGGDVLGGIIFCFLLFFFVFLLGAWVYDRIKRWRNGPKPSGASRLSGQSHDAPLVATVRAAEAEISTPVSERPCVAWGVQLTNPDSEGAGPVFLVDGATEALELVLEDGRVVHVPAGRCRVFGPESPVARGGVDRFFDAVPVYPDIDDEAEKFPLFPASHVQETVVTEGATVHLRAELAPADSAYREVTHWVAVGPVELTIPSA